MNFVLYIWHIDFLKPRITHINHVNKGKILLIIDSYILEPDHKNNSNLCVDKVCNVPPFFPQNLWVSLTHDFLSNSLFYKRLLKPSLKRISCSSITLVELYKLFCHSNQHFKYCTCTMIGSLNGFLIVVHRLGAIYIVK